MKTYAEDFLTYLEGASNVKNIKCVSGIVLEINKTDMIRFMLEPEKKRQKKRVEEEFYPKSMFKKNKISTPGMPFMRFIFEHLDRQTGIWATNITYVPKQCVKKGPKRSVLKHDANTRSYLDEITRG